MRYYLVLSSINMVLVRRAPRNDAVYAIERGFGELLDAAVAHIALDFIFTPPIRCEGTLAIQLLIEHNHAGLKIGIVIETVAY